MGGTTMKRSLTALTAALISASSLALISSASAASLTVGFSQIGSNQAGVPQKRP